MHNVNTIYSSIALLCAMQCTCDDGGERFYISFLRHNSISVLQKPLPHIVYYMLLQCMTQNKKKRERDWVIGGICLYKFALAWSLSSTEKHTSECGIFWQVVVVLENARPSPGGSNQKSILDFTGTLNSLMSKTNNNTTYLPPSLINTLPMYVLKPVKRMLPDNLKPWWTWICGSLQRTYNTKLGADVVFTRTKTTLARLLHYTTTTQKGT